MMLGDLVCNQIHANDIPNVPEIELCRTSSQQVCGHLHIQTGLCVVVYREYVSVREGMHSGTMHCRGLCSTVLSGTLTGFHVPSLN
jgi:hypothetical protein